MSSILKEDQYFNNEMDFCRVRGEEAKRALERVFLGNRVSYFIRFESRSVLSRLFMGRKPESYVIRINVRDFARAAELVEGMENVTIIGRAPAEEWSPRKASLERGTSAMRRHASAVSAAAEEDGPEIGEEIEEQGEQLSEEVDGDEDFRE